jgi:outer membrane protein assembly factor BamA
MRATFFYDYGLIGNDNFNEIKRSSYGVSLDWNSPLGPIQFIFPKAISPLKGDRFIKVSVISIPLRANSKISIALARLA